RARRDPHQAHHVVPARLERSDDALARPERDLPLRALSTHQHPDAPALHWDSPPGVLFNRRANGPRRRFPRARPARPRSACPSEHAREVVRPPDNRGVTTRSTKRRRFGPSVAAAVIALEASWRRPSDLLTCARDLVTRGQDL